MPGSGRRLTFVPFVARDRPFALVADIDQHELFIDAQNLAVDQRIDVNVLAAPVVLVGSLASHGGFDVAIERIVFVFQPTD